MRRVYLGVAAAAVAVGAFVYLQRELAAIRAEEDSKGDAEILRDRLRPEARRRTGLARYRDGRHFASQPAAACGESGRPFVTQALAVQEDPGQALALLQRALDADPGCASAGRIGAALASRMHALAAFRSKAVARAAAHPESAGAQVVAAYAAHEDRDGPAMLRHLNAAAAIDPAQPLLSHALGVYHHELADPVALGRALDDFKAEFARTGDPGSGLAAVGVLDSLHDPRPAQEICRALLASGHAGEALAFSYQCLAIAYWVADPAASADWLAVMDRTNVPEVSPACKYADFGHVQLNNGHYQEALDSARKGADCPQVSQEVERRALLALGRYEEAAAVPYDMLELAQNGFDRALALALAGRRRAAAELFTPLGSSKRPAWQLAVLQQLLEEGATQERLEGLVSRFKPWSAAEFEARAGCGRLEAGLLDEATPFLARALALDPKNGSAHACRVYQLSLQDHLAEAARAGESAMAAGVDAVEANLGFVYLRLDRCEDAVPVLANTVRRNPLQSAAWGNLYSCLTRLGRDDEARAIEPYLPAEPIRSRTWEFALLAFLVLPGYLCGKLLLKVAMPARFGHLRFP